MIELSLNFDGAEAVLSRLEELEDDLEKLPTFTVGTGVFYSVFLEFGTSKMDAKPFFRPAVNEVRLQGIDGFIAHNTRTSVETLPSVEAVIRVLAFALERRVKEIITDKGLIDTGTMRASVVAIRGDNPSILPGEGEFSGFDSDSQAPPSAGRALIDEAVEI